jgi:Fe-S-cluster containining protein
MRALPVLSTQATMTSSRLVNCKGCTVCCEGGGMVYVRADEIPRLKSLDVPLVTIDGVSFIKRLPDGSCPMLDRQKKNCSIYEDRPLCCRLFPLDVLASSGGLTWAVSNECPDDRKLFSGLQGRDSRLGFGTVSLMASMLDGSLKEDDIDYFRRKEQVSGRVDILDSDPNEWKHLVECAKSVSLVPMIFSKKETAKEKYKRKLKEREERKKKKQAENDKKKKRKP